MLRLGEDMKLPQEEWDLLLREGSVRQGEGVCLGKGMFS